MNRRTVEKERFEARDSNNNTYTIIKLMSQIKTGGLDATQNDWMDSLASYKTIDGGSVNRVSDTEFQIVQTGVKITRI